MKNLEMIIRKETKTGVRFYKYGTCSTRLFPVKKADVELMMAEGTIEIVDAEGNVIWTPAIEEVVEEPTMQTVEAEIDALEVKIQEAKTVEERHALRDKQNELKWVLASMEEHLVEAEEDEEIDEAVLDCTGINFNDINDIHKVVDTEALPEMIQGFIESCTRFTFDQDTLILYRERKAVACASFFVAGGIAHIMDMGAGDVFQWDSIKGFEK